MNVTVCFGIPLPLFVFAMAFASPRSHSFSTATKDMGLDTMSLDTMVLHGTQLAFMDPPPLHSSPSVRYGCGDDRWMSIFRATAMFCLDFQAASCPQL